tara:strand:- start:185 stop:1075 length:891 start_codon:yes stop_codon:yes gene_type:complete
MLRRVAMDIETDAIDATKIWVVCAEEINTGQKFEFCNLTTIKEERDRFVEYCRDVDQFIFHNGIGFDVPIINRLIGHTIDLDKVLDTLVVSRLFDYGIKGGHSLKAWGMRLGDYKLDFKDFSKLSEEMIEYCHKDVTVTVQLFNKLKEVILSEQWQDSLRCEHDIQILCEQMKDNGFYFNKQKAEDILDEVHQRMAYLENTFQEDFPPKLEEVNRIKYRRKADGSLYTSVSKAQHHYAKTEVVYSDDGAELVCYDFIDFNPASPKMRIDRLWDAGWKPIEKTKGHTEYEREQRSWG